MSYFSELWSFFLLSFMSFFAMVDPIGLAPLFLGLTRGYDKAIIKKIASRACLLAFVIISTSALFGDRMFELLGLSLPGLQVAGAIIFFIMGHDLLLARQAPRMKMNRSEEPFHSWEEFAVTPLAIPLVAGPGSITQAILLMEKTNEQYLLMAVMALAIISVLTLAYFLMVSADWVEKIIGVNGVKVVTRLMGLLLMVIAAESFFSGVSGMILRYSIDITP